MVSAMAKRHHSQRGLLDAGLTGCWDHPGQSESHQAAGREKSALQLAAWEGPESAFAPPASTAHTHIGKQLAHVCNIAGKEGDYGAKQVSEWTDWPRVQKGAHQSRLLPQAERA